MDLVAGLAEAAVESEVEGVFFFGMVADAVFVGVRGEGEFRTGVLLPVSVRAGDPCGEDWMRLPEMGASTKQSAPSGTAIEVVAVQESALGRTVPGNADFAAEPSSVFNRSVANSS